MFLLSRAGHCVNPFRTTVQGMALGEEVAIQWYNTTGKDWKQLYILNSFTSTFFKPKNHIY